MEKEGGQLMGYGSLDGRSGEVRAVFVEHAQSGRGVGKRLMEGLEAIAAEEHFTRLYLYASLNAADFYRAMGFVAIRDEAYQHPNGITSRSLYMERVIPAPALP